MRESSERSSPRAMSATRSRAIRAPLLAPPQKQPFHRRGLAIRATIRPPIAPSHSHQFGHRPRTCARSEQIEVFRKEPAVGDSMTGELNLCRESGIKPNFSDIARRYRRDRRTVAAYWKAAATGSPTGPSRPAPRALRGAGVPHHPRHPPGIGGLSPWIFPCGLGKRQWPDALLVRAGKPIRIAFPIKNGRRPAPAPKIRHTFCPISHAFCPIGPAGPAFPSRGKQKEGPAVSGGPLGNPWWSLGGSNP